MAIAELLPHKREIRLRIQSIKVVLRTSEGRSLLLLLH